jgi:uncharacterized protein
MKLHLANPRGANLITGYGDGYVTINRRRHDQSLVLLPEALVGDWDVPRFEDLTRAHFERILELAPEIVLIGTGRTLRFPHPALTQALTRARIGVEAMDTFAACRTYNILMAEGRRVAAALIVEG